MRMPRFRRAPRRMELLQAYFKLHFKDFPKAYLNFYLGSQSFMRSEHVSRTADLSKSDPVEAEDVYKSASKYHAATASRTVVDQRGITHLGRYRRSKV